MTVHCLGLTKPKIVLVDEGMASTIAPLRATLESKKVGPVSTEIGEQVFR